MSVSVSKIAKNNLRELIFGLEDGLVSTLGVVTGMASGLSNGSVVILTGLIVIMVESLSMAAGTYLSNKAECDLKKQSHASVVLAAFVMLLAYMMGGSVPLIPYLFLDIQNGIIGSVLSTVIALFFVGYFKGIITKTPRVRSGIEMVVVSLMAAVLGYLIGQLGAKYLGIRV